MEKYDCIYYWVGSKRGKWLRATPDNFETLSHLAKHIEDKGYVVKYGRMSIGAPEGPPVEFGGRS